MQRRRGPKPRLNNNVVQAAGNHEPHVRKFRIMLVGVAGAFVARPAPANQVRSEESRAGGTRLRADLGEAIGRSLPSSNALARCRRPRSVLGTSRSEDSRKRLGAALPGARGQIEQGALGVTCTLGPWDPPQTRLQAPPTTGRPPSNRISISESQNWEPTLLVLPPTIPPSPDFEILVTFDSGTGPRHPRHVFES